MSLPETVVEWRDLKLYGTAGSGRITFRELEGWEGFDGRQSLIERPNADGAFEAPVFAQARTVRIAGRVMSPVDRDAVFTQLGAVFAMQSRDRQAAPLRITLAGRTLTSTARLVRYAPTPNVWGAGWFDWAAEWSCSDPLRYGDPESVSTFFPQLRGGLEYDLYTDGTVDTGFLEYGEASETGRITLTNTGTADVWPVFQVNGLIDDFGFDIAPIDSDKRIRFSGRVPSNSSLVIDSASGTAVIDGSADRGGLLTYRDWFSVPAGGSVEIAFIPLGTDYGGELTAVTRPGYW